MLQILLQQSPPFLLNSVARCLNVHLTNKYAIRQSINKELNVDESVAVKVQVAAENPGKTT